MLTEQIEQGGFQAGDRVNGDAQVEGLQAATSIIAAIIVFAARNKPKSAPAVAPAEQAPNHA